MPAKSLSFAVVADDLTGALDTAAPFASHALDTWLMLRLDGLSKIVDAGANVIAVSTESRHLRPAQAAQRVTTAIAALRCARPAIVFKKIDSILRGNIGAEIVAALQATGYRHAFIAPAVPSQNRVMRGGTVYLNGMPLPAGGANPGDSERPESAHLPDLLQRTSELSIYRLCAGRLPTFASGAGLNAYVVDAETDADLDAIAQFVIAHQGDVLPVGASGLGRSLARAVAPSSTRDSRDGSLDPVPPGTLLYVIGSRTQTSSAQVLALLRAGAEEIVVPIGIGNDIEVLIERQLSGLKAPALLILRPESTVPSCASPSDIAERLGRAASLIVRRLGMTAIAMAGGDTAAACLTALNAEWLHVEGELHHGIAFGTMGSKRRTIRFFTKSGSFGPPDTWVRLAERLGVPFPAVRELGCGSGRDEKPRP